jgi:hypothetical protein
MVPTDDDVDLAYLVEPPGAGGDPLPELVGAFRSEGLTLQRNRTDAYWQIGTNPPGGPISEAHVDLFGYRRRPGEGGGAFVLEDPRFSEEDPASPEAHCNTRYGPDELFPLQAGQFYDQPIRVPFRSHRALLRALGPDCMEVMRARARPGLRVVELVDFGPA